jgi:hypothetical protein
MKAGLTLSQLAAKIEGNMVAKKDYVAPTSLLSMQPDGKTLTIKGKDEDVIETTILDNAHGQIAERIQVPVKYYNRMRDEAPELLAANVNHWFQSKPERRMVRTLGTNTRAFLSDRYQRIDDYDVSSTVLPILAELGQELGLRIESCELTERRLYIKAVTERISGEVEVGDEVQSGIIISNSEIGLGAVVVQPLIYRLRCKNGMIMNDNTLRAHHVGGRAQASDEVYTMLTDEALKADDHAVLLKVRDVVRATLSQEVFNRSLNKFREARGMKIEGNPAEAIEVLSKRMNFNETETGGILRHLIEGGDLSRWGVANAVTRYAQDVESYDRSTELEQLGGRIIELPKSDWSAISKAG